MKLTTCPTCAGWGTTGEPGSFVGCATCNGNGMWLEGDKRFNLGIPSLITPSTPSERHTKHILRYVLAGSAIVTTVVGFMWVLVSSETLSDVLWHRGFPHLLFGLGGIATMITLARFERRRGGIRSFSELNGSESMFNLMDFAHPRIKELLEDSASLALSRHEGSITEGALLLTLLKQPRIQSMIARLEHVPEDVEKAAFSLVEVHEAAAMRAIPATPEVRERLLIAFQRAQALDFPYADLEDLLLVYAEDEYWQKNLFKAFDLTPKAVLAAAAWYAEATERDRRWAFWRDRGRVKPKGFMNRAWTALPTPFLDQFSRDLTSLAAQGAFPLTLARDAEINRAFEVLGNPTNHNLLLVGEPGVGKETIITGIAFRMVEERVPEVLRDHRLVELDAASLLSTGNPEENVHTILAEIAQAGNVILALPDVQSLVSTSEGPLDAAAVLASALKQGAIQVISTASYADFHRYVEQNAQLSKILTIVEVTPPDLEHTIEILEEHVPAIEREQGVMISYPALEMAAELSARYLTEQVAPENAITLLGEAASIAKANGDHWVRASGIESAVEKRTGVPIKPATAEEGDRLLNLEAELHKRIVGQDVAVKAVADALRRARAGLHTTNRPIASFLFVGPTGVGKTEMAKAVAALYFGKEEAFLRLDMSEYQDGTAAYRLIGPPPGHGDFAEGGALTQPVREHPFSLILLDEIEKSHPDVLNLFLQLLDDGRLTENTGRTVHYQNTIVVATSNAASPEINKLIKEKVNPEQLPAQILNLLQGHFRPEFLNRFDAIVPFLPLTQTEAQSVTELLLQSVIKSAETKGITLSFTPESVAKLTELGYDPQYGGRPLRRVVQDKVEALLAKLILSGKSPKGSVLEVTPDMIQ